MELDVQPWYRIAVYRMLNSGSVVLYFKRGSDLVVGARVLKDFVVSCC